MRLTFLGTRGYIKPKSRLHLMNASLLISYKRRRVLIDYGETFKSFSNVSPNAIILTHGHPDHAFGLKKGAPCPVFATKETFDIISSFPIKKKIVEIQKPFKIGQITFEAFSVIHSIRAPAVGYKITAGKISIFYVPDVVWINEREKAFKNILLYIGDGACIERNMIRKAKKNKKNFGHANIRQQLTWCKKEKVKKMIITHCGSDIVKNEKKAKVLIEKLAKERGIKVEIAHDNLILYLK
jgi:ribonuclease BN (tRNA processing enzyme)